MMKYKSTYIRLIPLFMRKYMIKQYGRELTVRSLKKAPGIYREMLEQVDDIGFDNPMADNIYMGFVFMAIWKAADGERRHLFADLSMDKVSFLLFPL